MGHCEQCESDRIAHVNGKCADNVFIEVGDNEVEEYVPDDMNIGGGDYIKFSYCLDCGVIQGDFPLQETEIELSEQPPKDPDEEHWPSDDED